jgi:hypothetical protein
MPKYYKLAMDARILDLLPMIKAYKLDRGSCELSKFKVEVNPLNIIKFKFKLKLLIQKSHQLFHLGNID